MTFVRAPRWGAHLRWVGRALAIGLAVVSVLGCGKAASAPTPDPVREARAEAVALAQAGSYTAAAAIYGQVLAEHGDVETALALADLYADWGRPGAGLATLDAARDLGAGSDQTLTRTLALAQDAGDWTLVREAADRILDIDPDDVHALRALVAADLVTGTCEDAATSAGRLAQSGNGVHADIELALLLAGDYARLTAEGSGLTLGLDGCSETCDLQAGRRLVRAQRWNEAACLLGRAVTSTTLRATVSPEDLGDALAWLGEAKARTGHALDAEEFLREAVETAPTSPLAWLLLGKQRMAQGDLETARVSLLNAQRLDPANPAPCLAVAELKAQAGTYDEADRWIDAATERAPDDAEVWKAAARFYLARDIASRGDPEGASLRASVLAPGDAEAQMLVGWSRLAAGEALGALTWLDRALQLDPSLAEGHYLRALALEALGRDGDAREAYVRAADLGW